MVTGSADTISGRVADPTGERFDAIHLYRDLNGNAVLDLGIDQLLQAQADTTPGDEYAFDAGTLPRGRHVLHVAAMKAGAVVGSSTTTLAAARWWSVAIGSRIHGEARFGTTGDLVADPAPIELTPGPDGGNWKDAVGRRVTGTVQESYDYAFSAPGGAYAIGTARGLSAAFGPRHGIPVPAGTKLIGLENLFKSTTSVSDDDYDDQYWIITMTPVAVDLDVDSDNSGDIDENDDPIEEDAPGKRIFINTDDDNKNGIVDKTVIRQTHLDNNLIDKDFAEIRLAVNAGAASLMGEVDPGFRAP
jgi:hypothetical protein